jgi:energy-coupling factor transport system ATP-binding protein
MAFQYPEHQIFKQTVFDEVAYGARRQGLRGPELETRVAWALAIVGLGLDQLAERNPLSLSGGEMRRVALAGILVRQPEVLILDEPTANLDPRGRRHLLDGLLAWQDRTRSTLIVISHSLSDIARISRRAIILVEGSVSSDGPAATLLGDPQALSPARFQVPPTVALLKRLRQAGWQVRVDRVLAQDAALEIARAAAARRAAR